MLHPDFDDAFEFDEDPWVLRLVGPVLGLVNEGVGYAKVSKGHNAVDSSRTVGSNLSRCLK